MKDRQISCLLAHSPVLGSQNSVQVILVKGSNSISWAIMSPRVQAGKNWNQSWDLNPGVPVWAAGFPNDVFISLPTDSPNIGTSYLQPSLKGNLFTNLTLFSNKG